MHESVIKKEFDEWIELLKATDNEDMLKDPYNIWVEAWSIAEFLGRKQNAQSSDPKPVV